MVKDYRVSVKVRNNRILRAIEEVGGAPGGVWCRENGLPYTSVNDLINMTASPLGRNGGLSSTAKALCDALGKLPEDLWSNEQLYPLERNFSEMDLDYAQVVALLPSEEQSYLPDFSAIEQEETKRIVDTALALLSDRERLVIKLRYDDELTYDECGKVLGVGGQRVRQIEMKALRRLRDRKSVDILAPVTV